MQKVRSQVGGISFDVGAARIFYIAFADEILLLVESSEHLKTLLNVTCTEAQRGGLQANAAKTVLLTTEPTVGGIVRLGDISLSPAAALTSLLL
jgi:hypothetical protein